MSSFRTLTHAAVWRTVGPYGRCRSRGDNPTSGTNRPYPYAWRYRDWVIDAVNRDMPYNIFVALQLAGDLMPKTPRSDLAATGFLGAGPIYHKDGRLSKDVIENLYMDDWDERVDVVTRGVLGLTVACARCHDHKFDPISTRDYYALAGVFASTVAAPRPLAEVAPEIETRFMLASQRVFYVSYVANLMRTEPGTNPRKAREQVEHSVRELETMAAENAVLRDRHRIYTPLLRSWKSARRLMKGSRGPRRHRSNRKRAATMSSHSCTRCSTPVCGSTGRIPT